MFAPKPLTKINTTLTRRSRLSLESLEAREVPAAAGFLDPTFSADGKTTLDPILVNHGGVSRFSPFASNCSAFVTATNNSRPNAVT